jgi:hypothetical protein
MLIYAIGFESGANCDLWRHGLKPMPATSADPTGLQFTTSAIGTTDIAALDFNPMLIIRC